MDEVVRISWVREQEKKAGIKRDVRPAFGDKQYPDQPDWQGKTSSKPTQKKSAPRNLA